MRKLLDTEFDTQWIESQHENHILDVPSKLRLVLRVIRSVCAPMQNEAVDKLVEQVDSVDVLRDIFALVRQLQVDVLNYQLDTVVRPWLRKHAVAYEREKMAHMLESQDVELTTAWMQNAATRVHAEQPLLFRGDFAKQVFREALLDLCFAPTAVGMQNVPITLALDQTRKELQNEIQVLLTPKILACLQPNNVTMDRVVETVVEVSGKHSIDQLVRKTLAKDNLAYRAMENGLRKLITAQLDRKDYLNSQFKAKLTQLSLSVVHTNVCALVGRIDRLSEFNWQVHVQWYAKINRFIF
ncbi:T-complex protein 11 [Coemansia sp. RSA 678]|nr:T-complex protein 11 [Coemansia sp. RSA 678]